MGSNRGRKTETERKWWMMNDDSGPKGNFFWNLAGGQGGRTKGFSGKGRIQVDQYYVVLELRHDEGGEVWCALWNERSRTDAWRGKRDELDGLGDHDPAVDGRFGS